MPPKFKFTREQIISVGFELMRKQGINSVTARAIGEGLASSSKVIFSLFRDMDELKAEIKNCARELYKSYIERGLDRELPFKGVGEQYINFAKEEPRLFQLLFMQEEQNIPTLEHVLSVIDNSYEKILQSIELSYGLPRETADGLYRHLWIYSHGIAVLIATRVCSFSQEEVSRMLGEVFRGILTLYKSEGKL